MDFRVVGAGHAVLALLLLVELGLISHAVRIQSSSAELEPLSSINFMLFNTVWSILALAFVAVIPLVVSYAYHNIIALFVLAATAAFWLAGSIAVAAVLGTIGQQRKNIYSFTQPIVAFSFFIWALFTVLTSMEVLGLLKTAYYQHELSNPIELQRQRGSQADE
ncbi:hypothetical protein CDD83_5993 [Cordyceps sp. RAO-2017]|nr:hypothetical protein CDD83_5993 [Cordyceps sp. RAO-2017]